MGVEMSARVNVGGSRKIIAAGPIPPAPARAGLRSKDEGGGSTVMITMAVENVGGEKISLQDLYPPAPARKRDFDRGRRRCPRQQLTGPAWRDYRRRSFSPLH